ncbi:DUF6220 domain-containing protein [Paenibacillus sp. GYB003]|uniref:DUF6220 domain-containing protein n=1 Tax=Paenibacillus sp. GYB003 TaxID=2994392 RepID=UPI002F962EB5
MEQPLAPQHAGMAKRSSIVRTGRLLYAVLAWIFLFCIVAQAFIAGLAVFAGADNWALHTSFVRAFALLPLILFLLTFVGDIRGGQRWLALGLFACIVLQFVTATALSSVPAMAALHPVVALLLFWGSLRSVTRLNRP